MKLAVQIILALVLIVFGIGFYMLNKENPMGNVVVGMGVLAFAFILMPLFLYQRYRKKKLKDYMLDKEKMDKIIDNLKS